MSRHRCYARLRLSLSTSSWDDMPEYEHPSGTKREQTASRRLCSRSGFRPWSARSGHVSWMSAAALPVVVLLVCLPRHHLFCSAGDSRYLLLLMLFFDRGTGTSDFAFVDFNVSHGLTFVGASGTTACVNVTDLQYGNVQGRADGLQGSLDAIIREEGGQVTSTNVRTSERGEHEHISFSHAGFGNRESSAQSADAVGKRCRVRSRLTPSLPSKAGAMWYSVPVPVTRGFETLFTFQISDHSRECTEHTDPFFSRQLHTTCSVDGGDGLAIVLQRDPEGVLAIGNAGAEMGYGGLRNSLAVELDHRYNAGGGSGDIVYDHVGVHSAGKGGNNSALSSCELVPPRVWEIADGKHHLVKVKYFPRLATEYLDRFGATPQLVPYLKDNGEGRRLGTLVVWLDSGIESDVPLLALPINLSVLLDLPQDKEVKRPTRRGMDVARLQTFQLFRTGSLPDSLRIPGSNRMSRIWAKEKRDMVGVHLGMEQQMYKQPRWDTGLPGVVENSLGTTGNSNTGAAGGSGVNGNRSVTLNAAMTGATTTAAQPERRECTGSTKPTNQSPHKCLQNFKHFRASMADGARIGVSPDD